jgi:hypothetical protein
MGSKAVPVKPVREQGPILLPLVEVHVGAVVSATM